MCVFVSVFSWIVNLYVSVHLVFSCLCVFKDTLLDLLCEAMGSTVRQGKGFLVTGFPKNVKQAQEYEAKVSDFQE